MRNCPLQRMMPLAATFAALLLAGCQEQNKTSSGLNDRTPQQRKTVDATPKATALEPVGLDDLDLGQNWDAAADRTTRGTSKSAETLPRPSGSQATSDDAVAPTSVWVVVLGTFSGNTHRQAAQNMSSEVRTLDPTLAGVWVHSTDRGSIVALGRFDRPDDPGARSTLQQVKSIDIGGRPAFARAMLSRIATEKPIGRVHPHSLLAVRQRYPNVDPMYSLDIALWMADDAGGTTVAEARRRAEAYVQQLRAQGYEAYFFHEDERRMSVVTVGLFDYRAVDPQSGLISSDVKALRDRFPARLVNGEALRLPLDPKRPELGAETQKPFLVLVPE